MHIKLLPGAEQAQVVEATRLATRVSVNLEGPDDTVVRGLAQEKDFSGDLLPEPDAGRPPVARGAPRGPAGIAAAGTTTQFVVGAQGEQDREILGVVGGLERRGLLHHAHFSAFQPVAGTPMEGLPPTPAAREWRLYQAEHLLRQYGFGVEELVFGGDGNLALDHDPRRPGRWPTSSGSRWRWSARPRASAARARDRARTRRRRSSPSAGGPCRATPRISVVSAWTPRAPATSSPCAAAGSSRAARGAAPPVRARRPPDAGALEDHGAALRLPLKDLRQYVRRDDRFDQVHVKSGLAHPATIFGPTVNG